MLRDSAETPDLSNDPNANDVAVNSYDVMCDGNSAYITNNNHQNKTGASNISKSDNSYVDKESSSSSKYFTDNSSVKFNGFHHKIGDFENKEIDLNDNIEDGENLDLIQDYDQDLNSFDKQNGQSYEAMRDTQQDNSSKTFQNIDLKNVNGNSQANMNHNGKETTKIHCTKADWNLDLDLSTPRSQSATMTVVSLGNVCDVRLMDKTTGSDVMTTGDVIPMRRPRLNSMEIGSSRNDVHLTKH